MNSDSPLAKAKIYTKTGDKGKTRLVDGSEVDKFDLRVHSYGSVDELGSYLGICRLHLLLEKKLQALAPELERVQNELFNLGSLLACADDKLKNSLPKIDPSHIENLEKAMDQWNSQLPELKNFILSGGSPAAAHLHFARGLCRRTERWVAELHSQQQNLSIELIYLNRLSDWLFMAARICNSLLGQPELNWKK